MKPHTSFQKLVRSLLSTLLIVASYASCSAGETFSLAYRGDSHGLKALPYNISAGHLQAVLNRNPSRARDGVVTVVQRGSTFFVEDLTGGDKPLIQVAANHGYRRIVTNNVRRGGHGKAEVQRIDFLRRVQHQPSHFSYHAPPRHENETPPPVQDPTPPVHDPTNGKYDPDSGYVNEKGQWIEYPRGGKGENDRPTVERGVRSPVRGPAIGIGRGTIGRRGVTNPSIRTKSPGVGRNKGRSSLGRLRSASKISGPSRKR